ncbi:acid phosphatase/Vanadium-dependent haloperoxidase [Stipitochalara longipes BDJ]|nr:acid phosphatase/Vanadium-dependent haloperoxidase [Stipitochalara longipes BDJ]
MKFFPAKVLLAATSVATLISATYPGDVVQYWIDQSSMFINGTLGTLSTGLQTPTTCWCLAVTSASMYNAAVNSEDETLDFQQLAVSHAAHNTLTWIFQGARLSPYIDQTLQTIQNQILGSNSSFDMDEAILTGRSSALEVIESRSKDGLNDFAAYTYGPTDPGIYQLTLTGYGLPPDGPQIPYVRLFSNSKPASAYLAPPHPSLDDPAYEDFLAYVKSTGFANSTTRTSDQTDIALFWRESAPIKWNRFANIMVGNSFATEVQSAAKLRAQLNYAMFDAAVASWVSKFYYNSWRPETALHRTDIWLPSGHNLSQPDYTPLITPTPIEQEYTSGHATVGGAGAAVLRGFNGGDVVNVTISSLVTQNPQHVSTRHFTNLSVAAQEISDSRVFGGIHFKFSTETGMKIGKQVALDTLSNFDALWKKF